MVSFHKRDCFNRAKALVKDGSDVSLRYACLEIRQCIEAISYAKMKTYEKVVPEQQYKEWHPKRVYEFLLEMEPKIDRDFSLRIYEEDDDGNPKKLVFDGEHKTISLKAIKRIYNKLGYYLHTPTLEKQHTYAEDASKLAIFLEKYLAKLEPIVNTSFDMRIGVLCKFTCEGCKNMVYHNAETLEVGKRIKCLNQNCGMVYYVESYEDTSPVVKPIQVVIDCECGNAIYINYHKLKDPCHIFCGKCSAKYNIRQQWVYGKET